MTQVIGSEDDWDDDEGHHIVFEFQRSDRQVPERVPPVANVDRLVQHFGSDERRVIARPLSEVKPQAVRWLMDELIPMGELTVMAGRQGIGKSTLAYELAASVTRGTLTGVFEGSPRAVLIVATEDSVTHTIVPRLQAAHADLRLVRAVTIERADGTESVLNLTQDIDGLAQAVDTYDVALILIDPLMSRMSGKDTHKDAEVREALEPLVKLAHDHDSAALALVHVNKSASLDPLNLVMGSVAFTAVPRSVLFVSIDPSDESTRLLGHVKSNLGPIRRGSLTFTIETVLVPSEDRTEVSTSRIKWGKPDSRSIAQVIAEVQRAERGPTIADETAQWIVGYMRDLGRPCTRAELLEAASDAGWTTGQINKGQRKLGPLLISKRASVRGGPAMWTLREGEVSGL